MIVCILSDVIDSELLESGGASSTVRENCVAFANVLGLNAGVAAMADPVKTILFIVNKFVIIHHYP